MSSTPVAIGVRPSAAAALIPATHTRSAPPARWRGRAPRASELQPPDGSRGEPVERPESPAHLVDDELHAQALQCLKDGKIHGGERALGNPNLEPRGGQTTFCKNP